MFPITRPSLIARLPLLDGQIVGLEYVKKKGLTDPAGKENELWFNGRWMYSKGFCIYAQQNLMYSDKLIVWSDQLYFHGR